jgi:hypothetical protein
MKKAAAISLVIITVTLCAAFLMHTAQKEAGKTAQGALDLVKQVLHITPEVTINTYVTYQKTSDILELASINKEVDQKTHHVRADFPAPKILSVQQNNYKVTQDDGGYWNRLTQKDQELAVNGMNDKARAAAVEMKVLEEAKASLRRQLLELSKKAGQEWEINFRDESPLFASPQYTDR